MLNNLARLYKSNWSYSFYFAAFTCLVNYLQDHRWFTTSFYVIDPWIYWGAGNNLPLSYQSDFSSTYYLERYTINFQQILAQLIAGPYWSQLMIAFCSVFLITYLMLNILDILNFRNAALPVLIIFFMNRKFIGMLSMSYNQATSLFLYFLGIYLLIKFLKTYDNKYIFYFGLAMGLIANSYVPHFIVGYVMAILVMLEAMKLKNAVRILFGSSVGFIFAQLVLQTIHYLTAKDYQIVLLKHLKFGANLISNENPWGGNGFVWFWSKAIFSPQALFWNALIIFALLLLLVAKISSNENLRIVGITGFGTLAGMAVFSIGRSNFVGYSWFACVLYYILFPTLIWFFHDKSKRFSAIAISVFLIFHFLLLNKTNGIIQDLAVNENLGVIVILFLILSLINYFLQNIQILRFTTMIAIIFLVLFMQGRFFVSSEGGMESEFDARNIYYKLNDERSALKSIGSIENRRVWITPLEQIPLQSSMLYMYSLISTDPKRHNCSQVNWMRSYKSVLVLTNSDRGKESFVDLTFLKPCGLDFFDWQNQTINGVRYSYLNIN